MQHLDIRFERYSKSLEKLEIIRDEWCREGRKIQGCRCPQMVYEAVRDIAAGEELLLGVREPLQLQDMLGENTTEDRSDRETGEYRRATTRDDARANVLAKQFQNRLVRYKVTRDKTRQLESTTRLGWYRSCELALRLFVPIRIALASPRKRARVETQGRPGQVSSKTGVTTDAGEGRG